MHANKSLGMISPSPLAAQAVSLAAGDKLNAPFPAPKFV